MDATGFLEHVYQISSTEQEQLVSVFVMNHLDDLLQNGEVDECNDILSKVQFDKLPLRASLAFHTIVHLIPNEKLPAKAAAIIRLREYVKNEIGEDRAKEIFGTLT